MKTSILAIQEKLSLYALSFFVFFLPIYSSLSRVGLGAAIFFLLVKIILAWKERRWSPANVLIYLFFLACCISIVNSADQGQSLVGLGKLVIYFFVYLAILNSSTTKERFGWIVFILLLSASLVSLDGFYQLSSGEDLFSARKVFFYPMRGLERITASFKQAGSLGMHLAVVVPIIWSLFLFYFKGWKKILAGCVSLIMLLAVILSFTPGAAFGLIGASLLIIFLKWGRKPFFFLAPGMVIGFFILPQKLIGAFLHTVYERFALWEIAFKVFLSHPFIGVGVRTFGLNYMKICPPGYPFYKEGGTPYAHSIYVQMASEIGLLGLGLYVCLLVAFFRDALDAYRGTNDIFFKALALGLSGGFSAYLIHGFSESGFYTSQGALLFWLMLGLIRALKNLVYAAPEDLQLRKTLIL